MRRYNNDDDADDSSHQVRFRSPLQALEQQQKEADRPFQKRFNARRKMASTRSWQIFRNHSNRMLLLVATAALWILSVNSFTGTLLQRRRVGRPSVPSPLFVPAPTHLLSMSSRNSNPQNNNSTEMQSCSSAVDGDAVSVPSNHSTESQLSATLATTASSYQDQEKESVMSSVTHWSDIMRQENWLMTNGHDETNALLDSVLSDDDVAAIEAFWDRLMPTVSYLGTTVVAQIYKALCVAYRAHRGQMRKSGEPFIIHVCCAMLCCGDLEVATVLSIICSLFFVFRLLPRSQPVEVALLLSGLKMDGETVIAGLLHDTVEDTELTFTQVEALFGKTVAGIVEGETKVSKLPKQLAFSEYADEQAENLRQMFVAMTDDYRIIIVKLADRLHNMRTLRFMKPEKQIKISRETLYVYNHLCAVVFVWSILSAVLLTTLFNVCCFVCFRDIFAPLAHRMGIWQFKSELEDTAFMYLYPVEYKRLNRRLRQHQKQFRETLDKSQDLLQRRVNSDPTLKQQAAKVEVFGRTKELYSLWHKMETKNEHNLDNIMDVVALRVIITPKDDPDKEESEQNDTDRGVWLCYHVLGLVQHLHGFQPVPTKVKDYISFPVSPWDCVVEKLIIVTAPVGSHIALFYVTETKRLSEFAFGTALERANDRSADSHEYDASGSRIWNGESLGIQRRQTTKERGSRRWNGTIQHAVAVVNQGVAERSYQFPRLCG